MAPSRTLPFVPAARARQPALRLRRGVTLCATLAILAGCNEAGFDPDLRDLGHGFDTSAAAQAATAPRPAPDSRGVISYPNYQVAVAQRGDTVSTVAARVGLPADELARFNAVGPATQFKGGEVLALPRRVSEPQSTSDITTIASGAIDRAQGSGGGTVASAPLPGGVEPVRHQVQRGETAYTIARSYNVSVRALADWNGLGSDLAVHEGQYLMIPVALPSSGGGVATSALAVTTQPGSGSPTPEPPSASKPLPAEKTTPAAAATTPAPANLGAQKSAASAARFAMPVDGKIIRAYEKKKNDGIDISAAAGTTVKAAEAGTVAAITKDTDQVPILVIRHPNNLLSVYANIDGITVAKGEAVKRGQPIAKVRAGSPSFVHFEVRDGYDSVDPMPYLQ